MGIGTHQGQFLATSTRMTFKALIVLWMIGGAALAAAEPQPGDADFPTRNGNPRHDEKVAAVRSGYYNLVLIGDSITHSIGELDGKYAPNRAVWERHFAPRQAINLGMNGQRTEEILWNLLNGELDFVRSPKVFMLHNTDLMWDLLHPSPAGTEVWVQAVEPTLARLVGDEPIVDASLMGGRKISMGGVNAASKASDGKVSGTIHADIRSGKMGFTSLLLIQRQLLNPSHVYTYHQEDLKPGGGLWICDFAGQDPVLRKIIDSPDGVILDANLHYDGRTILFSWKKTMRDYFQLYSVDVEGKNLRKITEHESNNFNASWLPDGGMVFLSDRKPAFAYCWRTTTPILHRCAADGGSVVRISANYLNDFTPSVLEDGRIIYSRWEYVDRPAIPIQSLWAINPDGTRLAGVFGNRVLSPATFMDAREIPGSKGLILCVLTSHNGPCRGAIGIIDSRLGANAQEAITNLTPEIDIGLVDKGDGNHIRGPYLNPFPLDDKRFLVSKAGTIELRDYSGAFAATLVSPAALGFYNPQPVRARPREKIISSNQPAPEEGKGQPWATIFMQDVYSGLDPALVPRGTVKKLAVVQELEKPIGVDPDRRAFGFQFPVVSAGATYAPKKVWGYAAVEDDGSAYFKVPAQEPIYFLPLDADGRAVQRMRTFTHLMPGEFQGCIGCHADRNLAALNPESTRSSSIKRKPEELAVPPWGLRGFSYSRSVQPVWDKHCIRCHGSDSPAAGLELTGDKTDFFNVSYDSLVRKGTQSEGFLQGWVQEEFKVSKYTSWIPTYNGQESNILEINPGRWGAKASLLAAVIRDGHKAKDGKSRVEVSDSEKRTVYAWLDLNCPFYSSSDSSRPELRGCRQILPADFERTFADVTARRCVACHTQPDNTKVFSYPNSFAVRIDHPERNRFLCAPLAKAAGGKELCGKAVFAGVDDADYQKLLRAFDAVSGELLKTPRLDMMELSCPQWNAPQARNIEKH